MINPNADTTSFDLALERLAYGSAFIFAKFANLVDSNGNFLDYSGDSPLLQQTKGMMKYMIFGGGGVYGTPQSELDLNQMMTFINHLINDYGADPAQQSVMNDILSHLQDALSKQLLLSTDNPLPLVAWDPLMKAHQNHTQHGYERYRAAYAPTFGPNLQSKIDDLNSSYLEGVNMGRQMAAFFTAFYAFVDLLDKFMLPTAPGDFYVIPMSYHLDLLDLVAHQMRRHWVEHATMFEDYNKACALNDQQAMFEISIQKLESCGTLAVGMGTIFADFDAVERRRGLMF